MKLRQISSASRPPDEAEAEALEFLTGICGYDERTSHGVIRAVRDSGVSGAQMVSMLKGMAGRVEVGQDAGLEALVASVRQQLGREEGRATVRIRCIPPHVWARHAEEGWDTSGPAHDQILAQSFTVEAMEGMSLADVAKYGSGENADLLAEHLECACSGVMACSTCHVVVDPAWFSRVGDPEEAELDMLDLAFEPQDTSRLGCQIRLSPDLDGMVVRIPMGANNMMDHIPFPD
eukprot:CAMPEP_0206045454 /NCGR_PEP_ID=MMETSP1466-20131121/15964_1 /ASSEMBLY_ACC=CAM_ASM_001126 /TAXON_ID=44452 /ORGANISM="Pavlova gyrans, Strain CCMP608" /LENGTH=233 /DNA_ID=CAMNT_0053420393 /DNA_START=70 /DNA_END=771 /DNA_ORIENTATION=-